MKTRGGTSPMCDAVYTVERLDARTFRIDECGRDNCYLLLGTQRALLIDCSIGTGDLASLVKALTDLPLTVAATHAHGDHTGAGYQFQTIFVPKGDCTRSYRRQNTRLIRCTLLSNTMRRHGITKKNIRGSILKTTWLPMQDDAVFDLGERTVRVIPTPGHTKGSVIFADETERMLFTGDHVCPVLPMHTYHALPLSAWLPSAERTLELAGAGYAMWCGHGDGRVTEAQLQEHIRLVRELLKAQPKNEKRKRLAFYPAFAKDGCIHYDAANLY